MASFIIREATEADVPRLTDIHLSAFSEVIAFQQCYPPGCDEVRPIREGKIRAAISSPDCHVLVAVEATPPSSPSEPPSSEPVIAAWVKWVPYPADSPDRSPVNPAAYPTSLNLDFSVAYFNGNREGQRAAMGSRPYLYLATLATHPEHRRRGAARALVEWGTSRADAQGIECCVNSTLQGRELYARCGFVVVSERRFLDGQEKQYTMVRGAKK